MSVSGALHCDITEHSPEPDVVARVAPPAVTDRMLSGGLGEALARFREPSLLDEGKVVMIALDAVVERFGDRWALRCDQVYDHVDRTLERMIGLRGFHLKVSDTDYLICQPEIGRFGGQANALRALREILTHFLGAGQLADTGVHQVLKIADGIIEARRLDAAAVSEGEAEEAEAEDVGHARVPDESALFVSASGLALRVSCVLEPVFELRNFGRIGMRMSRRVMGGNDVPLTPQQLRQLAGADVLKTDLACLHRGLDRLKAEAANDRQPTLIMPVSYVSLSTQRGRVAVVGAFKEAAAVVDKGLIIEIADIGGVPAGALSSVISLVRPFALYVVGALDATLPYGLSNLRGAGFHGLSLEGARGLNDAESVRVLQTSIAAARKVARTVIVSGVRSGQEAGTAALLGATHASVRATLNLSRSGRGADA